MSEFFIWLCIAFFSMAMAEYWAHRLFMHKPLLGRNSLLGFIYKDHAIEHHGKKRNDTNIDLPFYYHLIIGSPILIFLLFYSWVGLLSFLLVFWLHSYLWTHIHRGIHDLESSWITQLQAFQVFRNHHIKHHNQPNKNYSVVFLFTDYLFGTKI